MSQCLEGNSNFRQQIHLTSEMQSNLEKYINIEAKVNELLELLSISKKRDRNRTKNRCFIDEFDHDNIKSPRPSPAIKVHDYLYIAQDGKKIANGESISVTDSINTKQKDSK